MQRMNRLTVCGGNVQGYIWDECCGFNEILHPFFLQMETDFPGSSRVRVVPIFIQFILDLSFSPNRKRKGREIGFIYMQYSANSLFSPKVKCTPGRDWVNSNCTPIRNTTTKKHEKCVIWYLTLAMLHISTTRNRIKRNVYSHFYFIQWSLK